MKEQEQVERRRAESQAMLAEQANAGLRQNQRQLEQNAGAGSDYNSILQDLDRSANEGAAGVDKAFDKIGNKANETFIDKVMGGASSAFGYLKKWSSGVIGFVGGVFDFFFSKGFELAQDTTIATYLEEIRGSFGSFSEGIGGDVVKGAQLAGQEITNLGGSLFQLYGKYGAAELYKATTARILEAGTLGEKFASDFNEAAAEVDLFNRNFGFTGTEIANIAQQSSLAGQNLKEQLQLINSTIFETAKANNLNAKLLGRTYKEMSMDTRIFGKVTSDAFRESAVAIRKMGIEVSTAKQLIEGFEDIGQTADKFAQLGAAFGVALDPVQAFMADGPDAIKMIREQLIGAGVDFNNLTKTEQRFLQESLSMNEAQLASFLDPFADVEDYAEEAADPMETMAENMKVLVSETQKLVHALTGTANPIEQFLGGLKESFLNSKNMMKLFGSAGQSLMKFREIGMSLGPKLDALFNEDGPLGKFTTFMMKFLDSSQEGSLFQRFEFGLGKINNILKEFMKLFEGKMSAEKFSKFFGSVYKNLKEALIGKGGLLDISSFTKSPEGKTSIATGAKSIIQTVKEMFKGLMQQKDVLVKEFLGFLAEVFGPSPDQIENSIDTVGIIDTIVDLFTMTGFNIEAAAGEGGTGFFDSLTGGLVSGLNKLGGISQSAIDNIETLSSGILDSVGSIFSSVGQLSDQLKGAETVNLQGLGIFVGGLGAMVAAFAQIPTAALVFDEASAEAFDVIVTQVLKTLNKNADVMISLGAKVGPAIGSVVSGITGAFTEDSVRGLANAAKGFVSLSEIFGSNLVTDSPIVNFFQGVEEFTDTIGPEQLAKAQTAAKYMSSIEGILKGFQKMAEVANMGVDFGSIIDPVREAFAVMIEGVQEIDNQLYNLSAATSLDDMIVQLERVGQVLSVEKTAIALTSPESPIQISLNLTVKMDADDIAQGLDKAEYKMYKFDKAAGYERSVSYDSDGDPYFP